MTKCSIAIVDDNEAERYILRRHLSALSDDISLLEFENGAEVLNFMVKDGPAGLATPPSMFPPLVIILDINMPVMGGYEFLDAFEPRLQEDSRYSAVVILMLSSSDRKDDIERAQSYSLVKDYFIKGAITGDDLVDKVKGYLSI